MAASIKVGTKVVCIDDSAFAPAYGEILPVKGRVYTIREILTSNGQSCFRLREIVNKPMLYTRGLVECSFRASRFEIKQGR